MLPQTNMQKYLYKAKAVALRGSIRKPFFQELGDHLPVATYAGSSGRAECINRGFALGEVIQYDLARTEIIAAEENGIYTTDLTSQIFGLRIGGWLSVDEVTCKLQSYYDSSTYPGTCLPRLLPAGSIIRNLRIHGQVQQLKFPDAFDVDESTSAAYFRGELDEQDSLQPGFIPEPIYVEGFGTIYYSEWTWVHPGDNRRQHLTMLRLALGSDGGASIDAGDGCSDGTGWPPTPS
jgi:hypothetical protein